MPSDSLVGPGVFCIHFYLVSENSNKNKAIGFPPPLLGDQPQRLDLLASTVTWLALNKPAGVGTRAYPWDEVPDLDGALNVQLESGKPELQRTGAELFGSVYYLDPEISGVAVFAKDRASLADLRNYFGSGECRCIFHFLAARNEEVATGFDADAPLLPHNVKPKMIPSPAKGKKSFTAFKRLAESESGWSLWEASTAFFRPHQVRAHAATHGIPVLGDALYNGPEAPTMRQLQPRARRSDLDSALFGGLAIHLSRVEIPVEGGTTAITSPFPKPFRLILKRLGLSF